MDKAKELIRLATAQFGELTDADKRFFEAAAKGESVNYRAGNADIDEPDKWGDERHLKANRIEWLCTDAEATKLVTHKGIVVGGVFIEGEIGLEFAKILFPLKLFDCCVKEGINLPRAEITFLNLAGTHTGPIIADGVKVREDLDRETSRIDGLTAKVTEAIEKLKEYRTALISAAVTGKIDVRGCKN